MLKSIVGRRLGWCSLFLLMSVVTYPSVAAPLEEIVVTATKRQESIQNVPISMSALSGKEVSSLGMTSSIDVGNQVPNMTFVPQLGVSTPVIFIRGIGTESFYSNSVTPVGIYNDGVYVGQNIAQGFQIYDIKRVEVLRGPQGTLFGRNTTGGLVNYISRKPEVGAPLNGDLSLTGGDFGQFNVDAAAGFPIGNNAAARVAISDQQLDGYFKNVNPNLSNHNEGGVSAFSGRAQIRWTPVQQLDILLNVHGSNSKSQMRGYKPGYLNCPAGVNPGSFQKGCTGPFSLTLSDAPGFYQTQLSFPTVENVEALGAALHVNWHVGDYTLTSTTSFDHALMTRFEDDDGNVLAILSDTFLANTKYWSQELRVTSNYNGPVNWIGGFYYYQDTLNTLVSFNQRDIPIPAFAGTGLAQNVQQKTFSWAVFGHLTYDFLRSFRLTMGLRLTEDNRYGAIDTFVYNAGAVPSAFVPVVSAVQPASRAGTRAALLAPLIPRTAKQKDWLQPSALIALSYHLTPNKLFYVSASRGFRGGEFNGGALVLPGEVSLTNPEFTNSYEIGYKGTHLNGTLQADIAAFYMQINDQIVQIDNPTAGGTVPLLANVATSTSKGFEFELKYQPNDQWFFSLGGGYLDARFDKFINPGTGADQSGNREPDAPKWTFNGIVRYEQPLANGQLNIQTDWQWNDDQFFSVENDPAIQQKAYGVVNARVGYQFGSDKRGWELSVFVKNLFDKKYLFSGFDAQTAGGNNIFIPGNPRTFGGQVAYHFD